MVNGTLQISPETADELARQVIEWVKPGTVLPERTQLQNLRALAANWQSKEALKSHIRYQLARAKENEQDFWKALLKEVEKLSLSEIPAFLGYLVRRARYITAVQEEAQQ